MDYILPLLGGISCKIYDDLQDNNLLTNEVFKECLKASQWILLTLLSYNDFNFTVFIHLINVLNAISNWDEWNYGYETSLLVMYPMILFLNLSTRKSLNFIDIFYIICFCLCMGIEPLLIQEEYSPRKFMFRFGLSGVIYVGLFISYYLGVSWSFLKVGIYSLGYAVTSSIFQLYMLEQHNDVIFQTVVLHT